MHFFSLFWGIGGRVPKLGLGPNFDHKMDKIATTRNRWPDWVEIWTVRLCWNYSTISKDKVLVPKVNVCGDTIIAGST